MDAARPWLSSPGWDSPAGPLRAMPCIWTSTAWRYSSLPVTPAPRAHPSHVSHPYQSLARTPSPGGPHGSSWLYRWDLCGVAMCQGRPHFLGRLLGLLGDLGNRFLNAALLGLSVERMALSAQRPQNAHPGPGYQEATGNQYPLGPQRHNQRCSKRCEPNARAQNGHRRGDPGHPSRGSLGPPLPCLGMSGWFLSLEQGLTCTMEAFLGPFGWWWYLVNGLCHFTGFLHFPVYL